MPKASMPVLHLMVAIRYNKLYINNLTGVFTNVLQNNNPTAALIYTNNLIFRILRIVCPPFPRLLFYKCFTKRRPSAESPLYYTVQQQFEYLI
jgi:hypothetical protein